ncbi:MAG: diguanylate cyclase, partial [Chloroflexi bacterium]|nr:diguanylate cyclase [Chloroflexota bacterium]
MAEMAGLAMSSHAFADLVQAVLDLIVEVVSSPFLALAIQEAEQVGVYLRVGDGIDELWADEVERYVAVAQRDQILRPAAQRPVTYHIPAPAAWIATFPAQSRSGRRCLLTLACPRPLALQPDEEQVMERLARQALLVLDHALLLEKLESLEVTDGLTGVANHRRLLEVLDYEMQRHRYVGRWLSVLLLDVEGLDGINRSYGRHY